MTFEVGDRALVQYPAGQEAATITEITDYIQTAQHGRFDPESGASLSDQGTYIYPLPENWVDPEATPDWAGFYQSLATSAPFVHARAIARTDLPVNQAYTDLVGSLGLAFMGAVNTAAIQAGYDFLKQFLVDAGQAFTESHISDLDTLKQQYNIPLNF